MWERCDTQRDKSSSTYLLRKLREKEISTPPALSYTGQGNENNQRDILRKFFKRFKNCSEAICIICTFFIAWKSFNLAIFLETQNL